MPMSAIRHVDVDLCLPISQLASAMTELVSRPLPAAPFNRKPAGLEHEHATSVSTSAGAAMEHLKEFAEPSSLMCPDCGGGLWEVKDARPTRYRCHTGHAFTMRTLAHTMNEETERALQRAIRSFQEQAILLRKAARAQSAEGEIEQARLLEAAGDTAEDHARTLRAMVEAPAIQPVEPDLPGADEATPAPPPLLRSPPSPDPRSGQ